jgi:hypothetical protein
MVSAAVAEVQAAKALCELTPEKKVSPFESDPDPFEADDIDPAWALVCGNLTADECSGAVEVSK